MRFYPLELGIQRFGPVPLCLTPLNRKDWDSSSNSIKLSWDYDSTHVPQRFWTEPKTSKVTIVRVTSATGKVKPSITEVK